MQLKVTHIQTRGDYQRDLNWALSHVGKDAHKYKKRVRTYTQKDGTFVREFQFTKKKHKEEANEVR